MSNKYLVKIAAYFDLSSLSGADSGPAAKSEVEITRDLKKTLAARREKAMAHMASASAIQAPKRNAASAAAAAAAGAKTDVAAVMGKHMDSGVLGMASMSDYGPGDAIVPRKPSARIPTVTRNSAGKTSALRPQLAVPVGGPQSAGSGQVRRVATPTSNQFPVLHSTPLAVPAGQVKDIPLGSGRRAPHVTGPLHLPSTVTANAGAGGVGSSAAKVESLLSRHKGKLGIAAGVATLGGIALARRHGADHMDKAASNAFTRNIGNAFSSAVKRGESGAHMMALREAKSLPASSAKSQALQRAMSPGTGASARHVTGNPKINREILAVKDIGNTNRAVDSLKIKAGLKSLADDKHLATLDRVNALKRLG